jgi:hypothetical protein
MGEGGKKRFPLPPAPPTPPPTPLVPGPVVVKVNAPWEWWSPRRGVETEREEEGAKETPKDARMSRRSESM